MGPYRIVRSLGTGATARVFQARDDRLDRDVALKVLRLPSREAHNAFLSEARALARLDHPSVQTLYDIGIEQGAGWIAAEFVDGETLEARLARGRLPIGEAIRLGTELAEALSVVHAHGLVHRDVKPANLCLLGGDRLKLLDFGIAAAISGDAGAFGTPAYMAPEQLRGVADPRSDVYGAGAVLYEMVTGRPPFFEPTVTGLLEAKTRAAPPSPSDIGVHTPRRLEALILRCLETDPAMRPASAVDLRDALLEIRAPGRGAQPTKVRPPRAENVLLRDRLFTLLDRGRGSDLVVVSGPAGSGKTTLVASWLHARGLPCVWHRADERDEDPARWFESLALSAEEALGRSADPTPAWPRDALAGPIPFAHRFFGALRERLPAGTLVVFDDVHHLLAPPVAAVLRVAVDELSSAATVVLVGREEPDLELSPLLASRTVTRIGPELLRFTTGEVRGLLRRSPLRHRAVLRVPAGDLEAQTEGWAAGLQLLLAWVERGGDPARFVAREKARLFDRYFTMVLDELDPMLVRFLLRTAVLPQITAALALRLTGEAGSQEILSELARRNAFTSRHGTVYRYHPLFRQHLLEVAQRRLGTDRLDGLRRTAAVELEAQGAWEDAADLLCEAEAWEPLTALLERHLETALFEGRQHTLARWLEQVPREVRDAQPRLELWLGMTVAPTDPMRARRLFASAYDAFARLGDADGRALAWAHGVFTYQAFWDEVISLDDWLERYDRMRADASGRDVAPGRDAALVVHAARMLAHLFRRPEPRLLDRLSREGEVMLERDGAPLARLRLLHVLLEHAQWTGRNDRAMRLVALAQELDAASPAVAMYLPVVEADCLMQMGLFTEARAVLEEARRRVQATGPAPGLPLLDSAQAGLALALGRPDEAEPWIEALAPFGRHRLFAGLLAFFRMLHALVRGRPSLAVRYGEEALTHIRIGGGPYPQGLIGRNLALAHLALDDLDAAESLLWESERVNDWFDDRFGRFETGLYRAELAFARGNRPEAARHLEKAMAIGRRQGIYFLLAWRPEPVRRLFAEALALGIEPAYVRSFLVRRGLADERRIPVPWSSPEAHTLH